MFKTDDFKELAFAINKFLAKTDLRTRVSTGATLMLEFSDVGTMHSIHREILLVMSRDSVTSQREPYRYIGDHTIIYEPLGAVVIALHCPQRFAVENGRSIGFRDIKLADSGSE